MAEWRIKVATTTLDAALVQKMFLAGAKNLESKKEWINDLNVFPVPDGDTGTNMTLTIMSAAKEVSSIANPNMENLSKAISSGSLRGARGNSGVILSQLLRGFTKEMKGVTEITFENIQKVRFIVACVGKIISAIYTLHSVLHFVLKYLKVDKGISKMKECL